MVTFSPSFPEAFLEALLDSPLGIAVVDRELRYTHYNLALARMNGSDPRAPIGQTVREVVPQFANTLEPALRRVLDEGIALHDLEVHGAGPDAGRTWSEHLLPLRDADGGVAGVILTVEEITTRRAFEQRLRAASQPAAFQPRLSDALHPFHDVTDARAATQRLEEINAAQRQFVSDAAHELRAPLTSILGNLGLLRLYPDIAPEERTVMLGDAERETTGLTRLIADLLSVARGETRNEIEPERVALTSLLEGAWRGALALSKHRRFDLGRLEPLVVLACPDALRQLFSILFDNAVKYSPEDGAVRLEARISEGWGEVRVYNDGAGIAPGELERVFERFYRTDRARSRSGGATGTGLGLTIARQIVERFGGRVWLESEGGRGTTAIVRLPRQASESAQ